MPDKGLMGEELDDGIMECVRYNPLGPSNPGIQNAILIELSTKDIHNWYINVHYHNHFTDGSLMTYGTAHIKPDTLRMGGFSSKYEITPTEFEYLNTEKDPCVPEEEKDRAEKVNLWDCLQNNHIASKLNCTLPWLSSDKRYRDFPLCAEAGEYDNFFKLYEEIMDFDTDNIIKVKCTPKCLRDEYSIRHFQTSEGTSADHPDSWTVILFFGRDRFHFRQQGGNSIDFLHLGQVLGHRLGYF